MKTLLLIQLIYYYLTALWALIHIKSFMRITGNKTDVWLVKTVSVLLLAIANALLASYFYTVTMPMIILLIGVCEGLILIDVYYAVKKIIRSVYLLDAAIEFIFILCWAKLITDM